MKCCCSLLTSGLYLFAFSISSLSFSTASHLILFSAFVFSRYTSHSSYSESPVMQSVFPNYDPVIYCAPPTDAVRLYILLWQGSGSDDYHRSSSSPAG
jgi:hypothetical protein